MNRRPTASRSERDGVPSGGGAVADPDLTETGRVLFAQSCVFVAAAAEDWQLPAPGLPEVAFAGRSNVGKSSLLNALTGRTTLARTSHTPGRTRQINLFELGGRLMLVDLPGYGYAKAGKSEVRRWTELTRRYLKGRPNLRRVCLLIDARHGLKQNDHAVMRDLDEAAVSYQIVLTKADKLKPDALQATRDSVAAAIARRAAAHPDCIATSAISGLGIAELRAGLATLAAPARAG